MWNQVGSCLVPENPEAAWSNSWIAIQLANAAALKSSSSRIAV